MEKRFTEEGGWGSDFVSDLIDFLQRKEDMNPVIFPNIITEWMAIYLQRVNDMTLEGNFTLASSCVGILGGDA